MFIYCQKEVHFIDYFKTQPVPVYSVTSWERRHNISDLREKGGAKVVNLWLCMGHSQIISSTYIYSQ